MKFLVAVTICLVLSAGAQANFFDDLKATFSGVGSALKTTATGVLEQGKVLGTQLLGQLQTQGTQLLGQAAQSLLLNTMNALQSQPSTKRGLFDLLQNTVSEVQNVFGAGVQQMGGLFHAALGKLQTLSGNLESLSVDQLKNQVDSVLGAHKNLLSSVVDQVSHSVAQKLTAVASGSKRDTALYQKVHDGLSHLLHSHGDLLQQTLEHTGHALTDGATNVQNAFNTHFGHFSQDLQSQLANMQLSGHHLTEHGGNALTALQNLLAEAMGQHQVQTLEVKPEQ